MMAITLSVGRLPPLLGHVNLGPRNWPLPWPVCEARETEEVSRHASRGVIVGEKCCEARRGMAHLGNF